MGPFSKKLPDLPTEKDVDASHDELPAATTSPVIHKEKHSRAFSFVSVLFLLMLLVAGVMTYMWYDQKLRIDGLNAELKSAEDSVTGLRSQLAKSNELNNTDTGNPEQPSDTDQIKKLVVAHEHSRVAAANENYITGEPTIQGAFARISINTSEGPGWRCVLKKVDGLWVILFCGQSTPAQSELDTWGVPKDFLES